jgi:hypothetical protein
LGGFIFGPEVIHSEEVAGFCGLILAALGLDMRICPIFEGSRRRTKDPVDPDAFG